MTVQKGLIMKERTIYRIGDAPFYAMRVYNGWASGYWLTDGKYRLKTKSGKTYKYTVERICSIEDKEADPLAVVSKCEAAHVRTNAASWIMGMLGESHREVVDKIRRPGYEPKMDIEPVPEEVDETTDEFADLDFNLSF